MTTLRTAVEEALIQVAALHGDETGTLIPIDKARDAVLMAIEPRACACPNTLGWHTMDCPANSSKPRGEDAEAMSYCKGFWAGVRQGESDSTVSPHTS